MKIIKLTDFENNEEGNYRLDSDKIITFFNRKVVFDEVVVKATIFKPEIRKKSTTEYTRVILDNDIYLDVKETPEEIEELLK